MNAVEIVGFVTGALCVWLTVRQRVANFAVGIANNVAFGVLFVREGLYAGACLQVVYLVLGALGWWWWVQGGPHRGPLHVRRTPAWAWAAAAGAAGVGWLVLYGVLTRWTDSDVAGLDSLTTSLSLVAQVMLGRKWVGSWGVWMLTDVLLVGLYVHQALWLTAVLYCVFVAMCVVGFRQWSSDVSARELTTPAMAEAAR